MTDNDRLAKAISALPTVRDVEHIICNVPEAPWRTWVFKSGLKLRAQADGDGTFYAQWILWGGSVGMEAEGVSETALLAMAMDGTLVKEDAE